MELEDVVLERIVPSPETVASIQERADRLKALVEDYVASHGITAEARFAGSFSKNTFLADPDLDLFLMFPPEVSPEDLRRIGLQAGEDILHGERMFSDHPYTRGVFEGIEVVNPSLVDVSQIDKAYEIVEIDFSDLFLFFFKVVHH